MRHFNYIEVILISLMMLLTGCADDGKYHVLLIADAKNYRATMTWEEIRESGFKMPYTIRVFDVQGISVKLFRHNHDDGTIMPLDASEIHISTPIIIDKNIDRIDISVLDHGKEKFRTRVVLRELKVVGGERKAFIIAINLTGEN